MCISISKHYRNTFYSSTPPLRSTVFYLVCNSSNCFLSCLQFFQLFLSCLQFFQLFSIMSAILPTVFYLVCNSSNCFLSCLQFFQLFSILSAILLSATITVDLEVLSFIQMYILSHFSLGEFLVLMIQMYILSHFSLGEFLVLMIKM